MIFWSPPIRAANRHKVHVAVERVVKGRIDAIVGQSPRPCRASVRRPCRRPRSVTCRTLAAWTDRRRTWCRAARRSAASHFGCASPPIVVGANGEVNGSLARLTSSWAHDGVLQEDSLTLAVGVPPNTPKRLLLLSVNAVSEGNWGRPDRRSLRPSPGRRAVVPLKAEDLSRQPRNLQHVAARKRDRDDPVENRGRRRQPLVVRRHSVRRRAFGLKVFSL